MKYILIVIILAFTIRSIFIGGYFTGDSIDTIGPARNYADIGRAAVYSTNSQFNIPFGYVDDGLYFNFTHPPMRVVIYSIWISVLGFSDALIMILPIIFGLLTIFFTYLLGKELYSEKIGLAAALISALLRYHVYASVIAFGDNLLMFFSIASIYFFIRYVKTSGNVYILPSLIFMAAGFLTKFSVLTIIPAFFAAAWLYNTGKFRKVSVTVILMVFLSFLFMFFSYPVAEHFTDVSNDEFNFFDAYTSTFLAAREGPDGFLETKIFYLLSFSWQFTPFFTLLLVMSLLKIERDKNFFLLASWFVVTFFIGFASNGQDFQRLMIIAIPPAIILVSKYISDVFDNLRGETVTIFASGTGIFLLASALGLNDLLPYYSPGTVAMFFFVAAAFLVAPKNRQMLLGASIGLSVFFLVGTNFVVSINSSTVQQMVNEIDEREYPYNELWTTRDISMYLAPPGEASFFQPANLDRDFLGENVTYFAFYSIYEEDRIVNVSDLCKDEPFFASVNDRRVGLVCRMK